MSSDDETKSPSGSRTADDQPTVVSDKAPPKAGTIGRYEIVEEIGAGATGVVYRAKDPTIGREVALKVIRAGDGEAEGAAAGSGGLTGERAFKREAAAAGALVHPNIVTLHDAGREGRFYYLAMEFISGGTFADEIRRLGRVPTARVCQVGCAVADALDFAHHRGVVHRDIKPSNILVLADDSVKLGDLGIARLSVVDATTQTGVLGTPNYVAPEQIRGSLVDGRADLFSLGVVLYEAATGRQPFRRPTLAATLNAILTEEPAIPADTPTDALPLLRIALKALSKDADDRYPDGATLAAELRRLSPAPSAPLDRRSILRWIGGLGVAGAASSAGVALFLRTRDTEKPADGLASVSSVPQESPAEPPPVSAAATGSSKLLTFGVMLFKPLAGWKEHGWMAEALRDAFNTQLSQLATAKVYSKEFLDFLITRKKLTDIEAMTELGIDKMISGSFTIVEDELRVDTYVVDVQSGLLEASFSTIGVAKDFYGIRNRALLTAIDKLGLPITEEERQVLVATKQDRLAPLRQLLRSEGAGRTEPSGVGPGTTRKDLSLRSWWAPRQAWAADAGPEAAIERVIETYRKALEEGDLTALSAIYTEYPPDLRNAQEGYFGMVQELQVSITDLEIVVIGEEAVVSYMRSDDFIDTETGEKAHVDVRLTKTLVRREGKWLLELGSG